MAPRSITISTEQLTLPNPTGSDAFAFHVPSIRRTTCCGMYELFNLYLEPKYSVEITRLAMFARWNKKPLVVFSDSTKAGNGEALKKFIHSRKLGVVTSSKAKFNPNSLNNVRAYIWHVDYAALEKFKCR